MKSAAAIPSEAAQPLDYDALYERYLASLVDDLRGFRAAEPGLELWVPDEDPLASLSNLLDAARAVGRERVAVRLSAKTLGALGPDVHRLLPMAEMYGDARLSLDGDGAVLDVCGLDAATPASPPSARDAASPRSAPSVRDAASSEPAPVRRGDSACAAREAARLSVYRPALAVAALDASHRSRSLAGYSGHVIARARVAAVELSLAVDESTQRIVEASFETERSLESGLLQSLCRIISGLPLLEAAEHGTIRLERALRGGAPRPVAGIVLPESVHPVFRLARDLLHQALCDYRRQTGFDGIHSRHDDRPGEIWRRASDAERRVWLVRTLAAALAARGLEPSRASVESIRYDVRVELSLALPATVDAPALVMDLERTLKAEVDPRLEVYVTERRDRNAKRRLAVLGGEA